MSKIVKRKYSSSRNWRKNIEVLVRENNIAKSKITLRHEEPTCTENEFQFDVISTIFRDNEVTKEKKGYKMMDGKTMKTITIVNNYYTSDSLFYEINVQSPNTWEFRESNSLLISEQFSDVTLSVGGKDINAHKLILANASPVSKTLMLPELPSNKIEIKDISYDDAYDILNFIYTGKFPDVDANDPFSKYFNLLKAADKYCIANLKTKCEKEIAQILSTDNMIRCFHLADSHNNLGMQQIAINFIVDNADKVIDLPLYQNYVHNRPEILTKIIKGLVMKQNNAK